MLDEAVTSQRTEAEIAMLERKTHLGVAVIICPHRQPVEDQARLSDEEREQHHAQCGWCQDYVTARMSVDLTSKKGWWNGHADVGVG